MVFFYVTIPDFNFKKSKLKNNPIDNIEPKENIKHLRHKLATSSAMTLVFYAGAPRWPEKRERTAEECSPTTSAKRWVS